MTRDYGQWIWQSGYVLDQVEKLYVAGRFQWLTSTSTTYGIPTTVRSLSGLPRRVTFNMSFHSWRRLYFFVIVRLLLYYWTRHWQMDRYHVIIICDVFQGMHMSERNTKGIIIRGKRMPRHWRTFICLIWAGTLPCSYSHLLLIVLLYFPGTRLIWNSWKEICVERVK